MALRDGAGALGAAYTYDPFGKTTVSGTSDNPLQFTGRENDGSLYHPRNRYYNPSYGRFTQEDPIGFAGGDVNLYAHVGNSPTNLVDPLGLCGWADPWNCVDDAAAAVAGGIANAVGAVWDGVSAVGGAIVTAGRKAAAWVGTNAEEILTVVGVAASAVAAGALIVGTGGTIVAAGLLISTGASAVSAGLSCTNREGLDLGGACSNSAGTFALSLAAGKISQVGASALRAGGKWISRMGQRAAEAAISAISSGISVVSQDLLRP